VPRLLHFLLVRHRHNWVLLSRFGLVGASGVAVNLLALKLLELIGPPYESVWLDLPATSFNIRWYHLLVTGAFFVANLWNFQLNRAWAFRSAGGGASWWNEYVPFLVLGLLALSLNLVIVTALMHVGSPIALPPKIFDDSSALRSRLSWANLLAICAVTPMAFVSNKLWTFRAVRSSRRGSPAERV
jgi:putative flippase GtrA